MASALFGEGKDGRTTSAYTCRGPGFSLTPRRWDLRPASGKEAEQESGTFSWDSWPLSPAHPDATRLPKGHLVIGTVPSGAAHLLAHVLLAISPGLCKSAAPLCHSDPAAHGSTVPSLLPISAGPQPLSVQPPVLHPWSLSPVLEQRPRHHATTGVLSAASAPGAQGRGQQCPPGLLVQSGRW